MNSDKDNGAPPPAGAGAPPERRRTGPPDERVRRRRETVVPTIVVTAIAIAGVTTAVMVKRADLGEGERALVEPAQTQATMQARAPVAGQVADAQAPVVKAPPLKPAATEAAPARQAAAAARAPANALGSAAACGNCGVVEMVVAVHDHAEPIPKGYQMHIRMDDGSVRTVEQRGALAAGSRVVVENGGVRALSAPG